jgi:hypothetical protein
MNDGDFDVLARALSAVGSRRVILRVVAGVLPLGGLAALLEASATDTKHPHRKRH